MLNLMVVNISVTLPTDMKRLAAISVSVMLSVVIIALGAGIVFVRCCHTQTMELAQLSAIEHHGGAGDDDCCGHDDTGHDGTEIGAPDCMKTVVVKLSSVIAVHKHQTVAFHTLYFPLSSFADIMGRKIFPVIIKTNARHTADAPNSPPRSYLRLIRILLI